MGIGRRHRTYKTSSSRALRRLRDLGRQGWVKSRPCTARLWNGVSFFRSLSLSAVICKKGRTGTASNVPGSPASGWRIAPTKLPSWLRDLESVSWVVLLRLWKAMHAQHSLVIQGKRLHPPPQSEPAHRANSPSTFWP